MKYKYLVIFPEDHIVVNLEDEHALDSMLKAGLVLYEDRDVNDGKIPVMVFVKELELPGAFTWRSISQAELRAIFQNMRR